MSSTSDKSSTSSSGLSAQTLVIAGIVWAVLALLFFLLFSVPISEEEGLPAWYTYGTYIFELGAFLGASLVCYRNWQSPQMVSGRNVWLGIGMGMFLYFLGNVMFGVWELIFQLDPDVSIADFFYLLAYLFLGWGMVLAVTSKKVNLEGWQWGVLAGAAVLGTTLAVWVASPTFFGLLPSSAPALEQVSPEAAAQIEAEIAPAIEEEAVEAEEESTAPAWVLSLDEQLAPFAYPVNLFYIIGDVILLIIATALLLAFWGGRFSQSWRMIAAATFSLYIADMYFKWKDSLPAADYESGGLLEVFFVFTGILFGIGAVLEFDISTRSRQSRRRGRGG